VVVGVDTLLLGVLLAISLYLARRAAPKPE
jgi:hypothetical protein